MYPTSTAPSAFGTLGGIKPNHTTNALTSLVASIPVGPYPEWPSKWNSGYLDKITERLARRADTLDGKIAATGMGTVVPDATDVRIGTGRHLHLAVMFIDICQFSAWPSSNHSEQAAVLTRLNMFMGEMLHIVSDHEGCYEKNTGDGLMAYFGSTNSRLSDASKAAAHCAAIMQAANNYVLTPWFWSQGLPPVNFRVGIDSGEMTIARVGIPRLAEQRVAIGSHANIACKIMRFAPNGGICIGDNVRNHLSPSWQNFLEPLQETGFIRTNNQQPYRAWKLNYTPPWPH